MVGLGVGLVVALLLTRLMIDLLSASRRRIL
jgi:hypothetical protein